MTTRPSNSICRFSGRGLERLKETVDVLSDPVLMRQIRASRRYFVKGRRGLSFEDVFGEPIAPAKRRAR